MRYVGRRESTMASAKHVPSGDSLLRVGSTLGREAMPALLYVYVEDADAAFRRAVHPVGQPEDR
jgi:hypothetical protein